MHIQNYVILPVSEVALGVGIGAASEALISYAKGKSQLAKDNSNILTLAVTSTGLIGGLHLLQKYFDEPSTGFFLFAGTYFTALSYFKGAVRDTKLELRLFTGTTDGDKSGDPKNITVVSS